jgi:cytochrome P450
VTISVKPNNRRWLSGDTGLLILAGSDTTSSTLTHIVYHLAAAPHVVSKLREELKSIYHPESATEVRDIQDAKYLNGVINEGLRLHHPAPSGFPRLTPQEGIMIDGTFIPGNVIVSSPFYSLGRCEFIDLSIRRLIRD